MTCKQCRYLEIEMDCGEKVVLCGAVPEEYPAGCWKIEQHARCPVCRNRKENGHDYTCKLANVLAKAEGKEE